MGKWQRDAKLLDFIYYININMIYYIYILDIEFDVNSRASC